MSILIFLIILAVLVFVHELGHFLLAKAFGVRVDEFSLGFPPRIVSWRPEGSETLYSLNLIPFGGYVKIFGENPDEESLHGTDSSRSLVRKPRYVQALVLIAGIAFNILFAWILLSAGFMSGLPSSLSERYADRIEDPRVVVMEVAAHGPAKEAGLEPGDAIIKIEAGSTKPGTRETLAAPQLSVETTQAFIASHGGKEIVFSIERGPGDSGVAGVKTITLTPEEGIIEGRPAIGITMDMVGTLKLPFFAAVYEGARLTKDIVDLTAVGLGKFISQIFTGHADFSQVSGPVGIAGQVGSARELGLAYLLSFTAFISINLALLNLVPFPALDGGRLLFIAIEAIFRRPIPTKIANGLNLAGFALLMLLMIIVTYRDILKLF